jgi:tetratricopeptide (TPR) repeat protein
VIAALVLIPLGVYFTIVEQGNQMRDKMTIESMYASAYVHVDRGNSDAAFAAFQDIFKRDASQEKAWHEIGKILNRFEMCDEAMAHYEQYVELFRDSVRGLEGYELAKQC